MQPQVDKEIAPGTTRGGQEDAVQRYIGRRLLVLILNLVLVSITTFAILRVIPGDIAGEVLGQSATDEQVLELKEKFGLNKPAPVQYADWARGALSGDLGKSIRSSTAVTRGFVTTPLPKGSGFSGNA